MIRISKRHTIRPQAPSAAARACLALALVTGLVTAGTATAAEPTLGGLEGDFMADPTFGGQALVYEGGNRDGPAVVLVHGLGDEASGTWEQLVEQLRQDYHILTFDLPGFGQSSRGNHAYTPDRYVQFLDHVIERHLDDKPFTLLGHSLGGAVSLRYTAAHPDGVEHLMLANVAGILHRSAYAEHLARVGADSGPLEGDFPSNQVLDQLSGALIRKSTRHLPDPARILEIPPLRRVVLRGNPTLIAGFGLAVTNFSDTLQAVETPTTIYWGETDRIAPLRVGRVLAKELTKGHLHVFEDTGHTPMLERPTAFNDRVRQALRASPPVYSAPEQAAVGEREGTCRGSSNQVFEGAYATIEITDCSNITLRGVSARSVTIHNSRVHIIDSRLSGDGFGARISDSQVTMTVGRIAGDRAIIVDQADLDIAGTHLRGDRQVIEGAAGGASEITLSVTPVTDDTGTRYMHTIRALAPGENL